MIYLITIKLTILNPNFQEFSDAFVQDRSDDPFSNQLCHSYERRGRSHMQITVEHIDRQEARHFRVASS